MIIEILEGNVFISRFVNYNIYIFGYYVICRDYILCKNVSCLCIVIKFEFMIKIYYVRFYIISKGYR